LDRSSREALDQGDVGVAAYAAREATHADSDSWEAWALRGRASMRQSHPSDAVVEFGETKLKRDDAELHEELGWAQVGVREMGLEIIAFTQATQADPNEPRYRAELAHIVAGGPRHTMPFRSSSKRFRRILEMSSTRIGWLRLG
jgi:Flp pilus assembly protein TadD